VVFDETVDASVKFTGVFIQAVAGALNAASTELTVSVAKDVSAQVRPLLVISLTVYVPATG